MLSKEVSEQSLGLKANLMVSISEQQFSIRKRTFDANFLSSVQGGVDLGII